MNVTIGMRKSVGVAMLLLSMASNNVQVADGAFTSSSSGTLSTPFRSTATINQVNSNFMGRGMKLQQPSIQKSNNNRRGSMSMFLGQDGILGVGAPEIVSPSMSLKMEYFLSSCSLIHNLNDEK